MNTKKSPRNRLNFRWLFAALPAISLLIGQGQAAADDVIFTIDPSQSTETFTGNDNTYGAYGPSSTLSAPLSGHFLVSFDSSTNTPSSIQFLGTAGGFYSLATPYTLSPGIGGTGPAAQANLGGSAGASSFALRNLTYDFNSSPILPTSASGGSSIFTATSTGYQVLSGGFDYTGPGGPGHANETGAVGTLHAGTWTLTDSAASPGNWTLSLSGGTVPVPYNFTSTGGTTGSLTAAGTVVSTAQFNTSNNVTQVPTGASSTSVLGGSTVVGGLSVSFSTPTTSANPLIVQQIPNLGGSTQEAVAAAATNQTFIVSTAGVGGPAQIWTVEYPDSALNGGSATVVFHYDPTGIPLSVQQDLGIWHYNTLANAWQFGGTVNTNDDTITYTTSSFSPFELGVAPVPEPSTIVLAALGLLALLAHARRRSRPT